MLLCSGAELCCWPPALEALTAARCSACGLHMHIMLGHLIAPSAAWWHAERVDATTTRSMPFASSGARVQACKGLCSQMRPAVSHANISEHGSVGRAESIRAPLQGWCLAQVQELVCKQCSTERSHSSPVACRACTWTTSRATRGESSGARTRASGTQRCVRWASWTPCRRLCWSLCRTC